MAGREIEILSQSDLRYLKAFIAEKRGDRKNSQLRNPYETDTHQAPETYVAMPIPCHGIPPIVYESQTDETGTGTGTDHDTGTSTGSGTTGCPGVIAGPGDKPGSAICDIFKVDTITQSLQRIGTRQTVYSLSNATLAKSWILITRDKYGKWFAVTASGREGVKFIRITVISSDPSTLTALCAVESWTAGYVLVDVPGDINYPLLPPLGVVEVCDPAGCYFDAPPDQLIGRSGYARLMSSTRDDNCHRGPEPRPPVWEVDSLCCPPPDCQF